MKIVTVNANMQDAPAIESIIGPPSLENISQMANNSDSSAAPRKTQRNVVLQHLAKHNSKIGIISKRAGYPKKIDGFVWNNVIAAPGIATPSTR